jgi:Ca2+/H+ antiporter, TMEM165/GDT1 family
MLQAAAIAFATVFVAELGDKSQLLAMSFVARYRIQIVLAGIIAATAVSQGLSVGVGALLGEVLPTGALTLAAGLLFVVVGAVSWLHAGEDEDEETVRERRGGFLTVTGGIVAAEFGDKTMIASMALAATTSPVGVWLGATAGMALAMSLAALVGKALWGRLPPRRVRRASAVLFVAVGVLLVAEAVWA